MFRPVKTFTAVTLALLSNCALADISFENATSSAGISNSSETYGASWGDVNSDGLPDLFVSHHRTHKSLYVNNGNGTFTDRGGEVTTWVAGPHKDTHGGSWGDFDNDGDQDLMVSVGRGNNNQFFVNDGGHLTDQTSLYNLTYPTWAGRLAVWFDYNNDGLLDFIMAQFNGISPLIKQTSAGFVDVTSDTGMDCTLTSYGQLVDVNNDGRMEFICAREGAFPFRVYNVSATPFINLTASLPSATSVADTVIADFDGDLHQDIFMVRGDARSPDVVMDGTTKIEAALVDRTKGFTFVNSGTLTVNIDWAPIENGTNFNKILIGSSGMSPTAGSFTLNPSDPAVQGMPTHNAANDPVILIGYDSVAKQWTFVQYSGAGFSNSYVMISSTTAISELTLVGFTANDGLLPPALFKNYRSGAINTADQAGLGTPVSCISAVAEDFDNDMDMDLYVACRAGAQNIANRLYENRGNGVFDLVSAAGGAQGPIGISIGSGAGTADSVVVADYDVDGFPDLFVANGLNMRPLYLGGPDQLYRNLGNSNHWVELDLVGSTSNRDAVGGRVIATAGGKSQLREQNGGYHRWSQNSTRLHFGLAGNSVVDLRVEWPSGNVDLHSDVAVDMLYRISEGGGINAIGGGATASTLSINNVSVSENAGNATFTVNLSPSNADPVSIDYATGDVTAIEGNDYTGVSGTLTFAPGQTSQTVSVPILDDTLSEADETFTLMLKTPLNAILGSAVGTGTVNDNDAIPVVSTSDVSVGENVAGGMVDFTVSLSQASINRVTVDAATADGTAKRNLDYNSVKSALTFEPGQTSKTVSVTILDDALAEANETFKLNLSNTVNAVLSSTAGTAKGRIIDNDSYPCGAPTYNSGVTKAVFVWRDCASGQWFSRFSPGGSATTINYKGSVTAATPYTTVQLVSVETNDTVDFVTNASVITYNLHVKGAGVDGFNFKQPDTSGCFAVTSPVGTKIFVGSGMTPVSASFRLDTLGPC